MTAIIMKPGHKRHDSCDLALPKWAKAPEKFEKRAQETLKVYELGGEIVVKVEDTRENGQTVGNIEYLGVIELCKLKVRFRKRNSIVVLPTIRRG